MKVAEFDIEVERKQIQHIHLAVYPPDGRVHLSASEKATDDDLQMFLFSKLPWIREQVFLVQKQERQPSREFVSGENHYLFGQRYLLKVIPCNDKAHVVLSSKFLEMHIRRDSSVERRGEILNDFYRTELQRILVPLIAKWGQNMGENPETFRWTVLKMKMQWGSCLTLKRKIQFNLLLARVPLHCIEYIVVHELCHLKVRHHDRNFIQLLDRYLTNWRDLKRELDEFITLPIAGN